MSEQGGSEARDAGLIGIASPRASRNGRSSTWPLLLLLVAITALIYAPVWRFDFIEYDDPYFLLDNPQLQRGLTRDTIWWALTNVDGNSWRPVANVVHLLAFSAMGPNPAAQHGVSVTVFMLTVAAWFAVLRASTGSATLAFVAAALWAWHPLRVENVSWLTETTGSIGGLFCVGALGAYVAYARRPSIPRYALVALCFMLSMMAKPTLPALPIALLAFDLWPLGRVETAWASRRWRGIGRLIAEKVPLLGIALAFTVFTAVRVASVTTKHYAEPAASWVEALFAIPAACAWALLKTFWPVDLSIHYPWSMSWSRGQSIAALAGLSAVTALLVRLRNKPLLAGWFWFLILLLPMLAASRYRSAWVADRYVYVPHLLFTAAIGAAILDATGARSSRFLQRWGVLGTALAALVVLSARQVWHWQDSETLFTHVLEVAPESGIIRHNYGVVLARQQRFDEARHQYEQAINVAPRYADPRVNLGILDESIGNYAQAEQQLRAALQLEPRHREGRFAFARLRALQGRHREAVDLYEQLAGEYPDAVDVRVNAGASLEMLGDRAGAEARYREALRINPDDPDARANLERLRAGGPATAPGEP